MMMLRRSLAMCLAVLLIAPVAHAQQHVIGKDALEQAIRERIDEQQADRKAIRSLLRRPEVKIIAAQAGLSLEKAEAAVSMLDEADLRELARHARSVQNDLAGGASAVVISTTTIIIILLLVILLLVVAD